MGKDDYHSISFAPESPMKLSKLKYKLQYTKHCAMTDNEKEQQDMELATWRKKIEVIGIDIKTFDKGTETGQLKLRTTLMD